MGAIGDGQLIYNGGAAYIFDRANYHQICKFLPSDPSWDARLGNTIGISSDIVVVGAKFDQNHLGAAYVFDANDCTFIQKLTASDGSAQDDGDWFGEWVAIDGNYLIVGAHRTDHAYAWDTSCDSGAAYIFERNPTTGLWSETFKLTDPWHTCGDRFGRSVDLHGTTAIVGTDNNFQRAPAFVYDVTTGTLLHTLLGSNAVAGDRFAFAVGIAENVALVGLVYHLGGRGGAYKFDLTTGEQIQYISPLDASFDANFGVNVALSDDGRRALIGAWHDDPDDINQAGSAYLFWSVGEHAKAATQEHLKSGHAR